MSATPGFVTPNPYLLVNAAPLTIAATAAAVTTNATIVTGPTGNNLVVQYSVASYAGGATKLYWFLSVSLTGDNYYPLQIPNNATALAAPFGGKLYNSLSLKTDVYEVNSSADVTGCVIIPFLFHSAKFNAFTDAGTATLTIFRNSPAVA
jgi:hypothetical protein